MPINLILKNHSAHNPENNTLAQDKGDDRSEGKYLWQLSQAQNATAELYYSANDINKTSCKGTLVALLAQLTLQIAGISSFGARTITKNLTPLASLGQGIMPQNLPSSPYANGVPNSIYQFISSFNDPLRFPSAEGAYIPTAYSTRQQNQDIHTKLYALRMFESNIEDEDNLSLESLGEQQNSDINNVVFVIDSVTAAKKNNDYETTKLKTITDMLLGNDKSLRKDNLGGTRKLPIIDDWIERQVFGDKLYKYLRTQILENHHQGLDLVAKLTQNIDEKLREAFGHFPVKKSESLMKYVRGNIVNIEFPAYSYEFYQSHLDPFHWGLCHAGYYFLNKLMIDVAKFKKYEVYARGYELYHQFRAGRGYEGWVRFFSLPAMIHYIQSMPSNDVDFMVAHPLLFQETALNAYFNYRPDKASGENPIVTFHASVKHFIEFLSSPDKTNNANERDIIYDRLQRKLSVSYQAADEVYINTAFSSLPRADYDFIIEAKISPGKFSLGLPEERKVNGVNTRYGIHHILATLFENPSYVKIFQCTSDNERRIYALQYLPSGYVVKRVDSDASLYRELLTNEDKIRFKHNTVLSKRFKNEEINNQSDGIKKLAEYTATGNVRAIEILLDEVDWQNDEPQDVIDSLRFSNQVAFHQCFVNPDNDASNPVSLGCRIDYATQHLIPFFIRSTRSHIDAHNELDRLKATSGRDVKSGFAMALAVQQAFEQAPDNSKSRIRYFADSSPEEWKSDLEKAISNGVASLGEDQGEDNFYSLNSIEARVSLLSSRYIADVVDKRGHGLDKIHKLTHNAYRSMLGCFYEILSPEDHLSHSQGEPACT